MHTLCHFIPRFYDLIHTCFRKLVWHFPQVWFDCVIVHSMPTLLNKIPWFIWLLFLFNFDLLSSQQSFPRTTHPVKQNNALFSDVCARCSDLCSYPSLFSSILIYGHLLFSTYLDILHVTSTMIYSSLHSCTDILVFIHS